MTRTIDPAVEMLLAEADALGVSTAFSRAAKMAPCPIGEDGRCCKNCHMGPCRLVKPGQRGVCGASSGTVAARNLARAIAVGAAAHSDHGLDMAFTLEAVAKGEAPVYEVLDVDKLRAAANYLRLKPNGRSVKVRLEEMAADEAGQARRLRGLLQGM
jgi:carbon-monoxide dehydrogenase catalytic subunit